MTTELDQLRAENERLREEGREAAEVWAQVHTGMQRFGMESSAIDALSDYFAALSEQEKGAPTANPFGAWGATALCAACGRSADGHSMTSSGLGICPEQEGK